MNNELENWIYKRTKDFHRPKFFTGHYTDNVCESPKSNYIATKINKHFFNELHRRVYVKSKNKIPRTVVLQKGKHRIHTHMILETPQHISSFRFNHLINQSWLKTRGGIDPKVIDAYDQKGLSGYCSRERIESWSVDIENCT